MSILILLDSSAILTTNRHSIYCRKTCKPCVPLWFILSASMAHTVGRPLTESENVRAKEKPQVTFMVRKIEKWNVCIHFSRYNLYYRNQMCSTIHFHHNLPKFVVFNFSSIYSSDLNFSCVSIGSLSLYYFDLHCFPGFSFIYLL